MKNNERFELSLRDGHVYVRPQDEQNHPLLAKLYGYSEGEATVPPTELADPMQQESLAEAFAWIRSISDDLPLQVDVVGQTDENRVVEITDLAEAWAQAAVDLTNRVRARGLPVLSVRWDLEAVYREGYSASRGKGGIVLLGHGTPVISVPRGVNVTDAECEAAVDALLAHWGDADQLIWNVDQLLEAEGEETFAELGRGIYKGVACGPWVAAIVRGRTSDMGYEEPEARKTDWHSDCVGVRVGSIVEGSDAYVDRDPLLFPFTHEAFWNLIRDVDAEADELWHAANGEDGE